MVPRMAKGGRSFKGSALYYLHDRREEGEAERLTSERVAWVETVNLGTADPERAWRIMAHTAMAQAELKAAAGVKATGRKLANPVQNFSLGWRPDERPTKADMLEAAHGALQALGWQECQAMIVCHNDTDHAHVHVIVNRVNPKTGIAAPDSRAWRKLSDWASAYEKARGAILCPEREENAQKRAKGEQTKYHDKPRKERQAEKTADAGGMAFDFIRAEQKAKDAQLEARGRALAEAHAGQWETLKRDYQAGRARLLAEAERQCRAKTDEIKADFKPKWAELFRKQRAEGKAFERREGSFLGFVWNAFQTARELRRQEQATGIDAMTLLFAALSGQERRNHLAAAHQREQKNLADAVRSVIRAHTAAIKIDSKVQLAALRDSYLVQCGALKRRQDTERDDLKAAWKVRRKEYTEAMAPVRVQAARLRKEGRDRPVYRGMERRLERKLEPKPPPARPQ